MKLTETQQQILQLIHGNGHLTAQDIPLRGCARKKVLGSLISCGLLRAKPCKNWINYSLPLEGATIADMLTATGWKQHTVRGILAGALKKTAGVDHHLG